MFLITEAEISTQILKFTFFQWTYFQIQCNFFYFIVKSHFSNAILESIGMKEIKYRIS